MQRAKRQRTEEDAASVSSNLEHVIKNEDAVLIPTENEQQWESSKTKCPYLDTICRSVIDFDMEKVCSVSLSNMHVYCCLVCGKFYQGRGKATPAYTHSVQQGHFVFLHLSEGRFFCLPDNYEIVDSSLDDIKACLAPAYSLADLKQLDRNKDVARDVHGMTYLPGFRGINNLCNTDYLNCVVHALSHVRPLRDFLLQPTGYAQCRSAILQHLGAFTRRSWSSRNFKCGASPQELVHAISDASQKKFASGTSADSIDFLNWLLAEINRALAARTLDAVKSDVSSKVREQTIVTQCFQGLIEVTEQRRKALSTGTDHPWTESVRQVNFNHLSLDIPPPPLFKEGEGGLVIPQVPIFELLQKFNGSKWTETLQGDTQVRRKYKILRLPPYLVFHLVRSSDSASFRKDRNPTIVTFPLKHLDMSGLCTPPSSSSFPACPAAETIHDLSIRELKALLLQHGTDEHKMILQGTCEKSELLAMATSAVNRAAAVSANKYKYNLVANICRESMQTTALKGVTVGATTESSLSRVSVQESHPFKVHLRHRPTDKWFELKDLLVSEIAPQLIALSESSILFYENANSI
jgi:U4/U6.U5 tri-snRNP-associated protein 2